MIPKIYNGHDRTFFLVSWESYRQVQGQTQLDTVPTLLERQGNFSQSVDSSGKPIALKDPLGTVFPANPTPPPRQTRALKRYWLTSRLRIFWAQQKKPFRPNNPDNRTTSFSRSPRPPLTTNKKKGGRGSQQKNN